MSSDQLEASLLRMGWGSKCVKPGTGVRPAVLGSPSLHNSVGSTRCFSPGISGPVLRNPPPPKHALHSDTGHSDGHSGGQGPGAASRCRGWARHLRGGQRLSQPGRHVLLRPLQPDPGLGFPGMRVCNESGDLLITYSLLSRPLKNVAQTTEKGFR